VMISDKSRPESKKQLDSPRKPPLWITPLFRGASARAQTARAQDSDLRARKINAGTRARLDFCARANARARKNL